MKIIGIGDLVTDYYYQDSKFLGLCGGMTVFNILANLSKYYETYAIGICGNDDDGDIAIKSLNDIKVNTNYVKRKDILTRCFHVNITENGVTSKKRCPSCNRKKWYEDIEELIKIPDFLFEDKENLFVFDTINDRNLKLIEVIKQQKCKIVIDIGQIGVLENYEKESIVNILKNKFDVVQLNERVSKFLMQKFEYDDLKELNNIFNSQLIIITCGKKGTKFIHNDIVSFYELKTPSIEVDPTGAGDLFLSIVIRNLIGNSFKVTQHLLDEINIEATKNTSEIVKKIGARALVQDLYNKKAKKGKCICGLELDLNEPMGKVKKERKKTKKIDTNVAVLKKRIESDLKSDAYLRTKAMIDNLKGISIFCGTGGSYSASYYAAKVVNAVKKNYTEALLPREILYKNIDSVDNIITFSYSGTSNDILEVIKKSERKNKYVVTKGKLDNKDLGTISYRNPKGKAGKERGFLSFEGTIVPASLFARYYYETINKNEKFEVFLYERLNYWNEYWKKYFKENCNNLKKAFTEKNVIDTFYGDYTNSAVLDLESKIIETGVYRITMHEKKNFSHGRFISMEHNNSDVVIYFKTSNETMYEKKLLKYLKEKSNNLIIIESSYDNLIAEFDLLLSVQYLIKYIADLIDKDLSKPAYSEEAMKIYKHKGKI